MNDYVSLKEISDRIGLDRSNTRKWLLSQGFTFAKIRDSASRQLVNALSVEDAERAMQLRSRQGFDARSVKAVPVDDGNGFFYVVRLMPDVAPNRVKIGYANSLESRLAAHRTTCPRLELAQSWPCRRVFEPAAIAAAVNGSATCYGGEVYDVGSVEDVVHRLDGFFEMLG